MAVTYSNTVKDKRCNCCGITKSFSDFYSRESSKDGLHGQCKACLKMKAIDTYWRNSELIKAKKRETYATDDGAMKAKVQEWRSRNMTSVAAHNKKYHQKNKLQRNAYCKEYQKNNLAFHTARMAARRAREKIATLKSCIVLTRFVFEEAHKLRLLRNSITGIKWHVDHIIPLKARLVSGLHVWNNFQVIPATENLSKKNTVGALVCL